MATLHFIWWGPFNPASCARAKEVAATIGPTPITFWCKYGPEFRDGDATAAWDGASVAAYHLLRVPAAG